MSITHSQVIASADTGTSDVAAISSIYIDPQEYGVKGDAVGILDAIVAANKLTVTSTQYKFTQDDVGKECHLPNQWEGAGLVRKIVSVSNGAATLNQATVWSGAMQIIVGTDDTLAFEAALEAAATAMLTTKQLGAGADPESWGPAPAAGTLKLRAGAGYLVRNTQARYDAGKLGAINIPRGCGIEGGGMNQTAIYIGYGNIGHGIANAGALNSRADEKIYLAHFTIYGTRQSQSSACLDNIHIEVGMNDYTSVDNFSYVGNIISSQSRRHAFYLKGRGENVFHALWALYAKENGYYINAIQDSRFSLCNAGGNGKAGFWVGDGAASTFDNCKSFYNGSSGGTNLTDTCNWYIGDSSNSYLKGSMMFIGCESQESRGSGWYIKGGNCQYVGCLSSDPRRFGGSPWPSVCAGVHLDANASNNVFAGFYIRPALGYDWSLSGESHYGGDYALYIGYQSTGNVKTTGPRGNKGHIFTLEPSRYNVKKIGGPGTTNTLNGGLYVDGDPLPSDIPSAPVLDSVAYGESAETILYITVPTDDGGRSVTNYIYDYKLSSEPTTWTNFYHTPNADPTAAIITGLVAASEYNIRCAAVNANGQSTWSNTITYTHSPAVPKQVTGLAARIGSTAIYLTWTAPLTGGSPITDYLIEYKANSSGTWLTFTDGTSTNASATVTGLTNDTLYDFRVSAINAVGTGTASDVVSATPLAIMSGVTDSTILGYYDAYIASSIVDGGDGAIESWTDLSRSTNNDIVQATTARKPTKGVENIGSVPSISFDGIDDNMSLPSGIMSTLLDGSFSCAFVFKLNLSGLAKTNTLLYSNSGGFLFYVRCDIGDIIVRCGADPSASVLFTPDTNAHVVVAKRSGATLKLWVDGVESATVTATNITPTSIAMGWSNQYYGQFNGAIGAAVFYNSTPISALNATIAQWATNYGTASFVVT